MKPQKKSGPKKPQKAEVNSAKTKTYWAEIGLAVVVLFAIYVRVRLLGIPLERDEGEYAYLGQLILKGIAPYVEAYNMKFPGTYFCYAFIEMLFGQTISGIHTGLLFFNVGAIIMIFFLAKKMLPGGWYAVIASAVYALISVSYTVLGFAAHATHFVVFFALAGILILYKAIDKKKIWLFALAGFVTGLSYLSKQSGVFFLGFAGLLILISAIREKPFALVRFLLNGSSFVLGSLLPLGLTIVILWKAGSLDTFYFWTFKYASAYGSEISLSQAPEVFKVNFQGMWNSYGYFFLLGLAGILTVFFIRGFFKNALSIVLFFLFSFLCVCPGFFFRQHYFIQMLPALGIAVAAACYFLDYLITNNFKRKSLLFVKYILFGAIAWSGINKESFYLFKEKPIRLCKGIYGSNPFTESLPLSQYLKEHTTEQDKIVILGSEPQIFFYSGRKSATGYIYTYNLVENQPFSLQMQNEMISEVEKAKPKYLLFVNVGMSWLARPGSEKHIFEWYDKYSRENYKLAALMEIDGSISGNFVTENLSSYQPKTKEYVVVFERKS